MSVRKLVFWWFGVTILILLYAGLDVLYHPEVATSTLEDLNLTPNPEWSLLETIENGAHVGGRLLGALGWLHFTILALFVSGFVVAILSLFRRDEDDTE